MRAAREKTRKPDCGLINHQKPTPGQLKSNTFEKKRKKTVES